MVTERAVTRTMIRLREFRHKSGYSQTELAERSGVAQSVISDIETGVTKNPGVGIVVKLANTLGIPFTDLVAENSASDH